MRPHLQPRPGRLGVLLDAEPGSRHRRRVVRIARNAPACGLHRVFEHVPHGCARHARDRFALFDRRHRRASRTGVTGCPVSAPRERTVGCTGCVLLLVSPQLEVWQVTRSGDTDGRSDESELLTVVQPPVRPTDPLLGGAAPDDGDGDADADAPDARGALDKALRGKSGEPRVRE